MRVEKGKHGLRCESVRELARMRVSGIYDQLHTGVGSDCGQQVEVWDPELRPQGVEAFVHDRETDRAPG